LINPPLSSATQPLSHAVLGFAPIMEKICRIACVSVSPVSRFLHVTDSRFPAPSSLTIWQTRHGVHGDAGQVIVGADADHVGIRELIVKQRVRVSSVSVVGRPGSARVGCVRDGNSGENQREASHPI
jgi:hypothetical protein